MGREPWAGKNDRRELEPMVMNQLQRRIQAWRRSRSVGGINLAAAIHGTLGGRAAQGRLCTLHRHTGRVMMVAHHLAVRHVVCAPGVLACFAGGRPERRKPRANKGCNDRDGEYPPHFKVDSALYRLKSDYSMTNFLKPLSRAE